MLVCENDDSVAHLHCLEKEENNEEEEWYCGRSGCLPIAYLESINSLENEVNIKK